MHNLESRLTKIEHDLRRWKRISFALVLGLIGLIALAAQAPDTSDVLRCRRLEVLNGNGTVVTRIEALPKELGGDGGWISCFSNDGKPKLRMGAQVGGDAELDVVSGSENLDGAISMNASREGGGQITLNGPNEAPFVKIAAPPGKAGIVSISNRSGAPLWHAGPK